MRRARKAWPEAAWGVFAAANVALMFFITDWETIPLHIVWVSLALLFCVRQWSLRVTTALLLCVVVFVGGAFTYVVAGNSEAGYDEIAEVPMMAVMFLVIVFYARRREQALEEVQRVAKREQDFIQDVSHCLRTPITIALGHAELIRAESGSQLAEDAEIVLEELQRISTISDRLLLLASSADERFLAREEVDVGHLVRGAWRRWRGTAPRNWETTVSSEGVIVGDGERLALALDCLIENAVKATVDGDTISIRSSSEGETVSLEVSDTGVGIPSADRQRIFERFSRGRGPGRSSGGAGLGLALTKAIAEAHGGSLEVESEPRVGTTFAIRFGGSCAFDLPVSAADYLAPALETAFEGATVGAGTAPLLVRSVSASHAK